MTTGGVIQKANLYTREGGFVAGINVPAFHPPAEVIVWGSRVFVFRKPILSAEPYLEYREGLAWYWTPMDGDTFDGAPA